MEQQGVDGVEIQNLDRMDGMEWNGVGSHLSWLILLLLHQHCLTLLDAACNKYCYIHINQVLALLVSTK